MFLSPKFQIVYNFKRYIYKLTIIIISYMVKRKRGDRSGNILNELNLVVLKTIKNNPHKDLGVGDLQKMLKFYITFLTISKNRPFSWLKFF